MVEKCWRNVFLKMQMIQAYQQKGSRKTRVLSHVAFWLSVWFFTSFVYGYEKQPLLIALESNLMLLPVHMLYFYTLAYIIIPKFLLKRKYIQFFAILLLFVVIMPAITRTIDIFLVEPHIDNYLKSVGYYNWEKVMGTKWERFSNIVYYLNAIKGANFIVWFGVAIKFFKAWYQRHQAALEAELNLLKAQIHPHFLFNTLNNLYALTLNNSSKSPEIVMGLSQILRYMLYECNVEKVPLQKDVQMLENFILLEKMRYEERLDFNFTKEGYLDRHQIAPLLLLPLVENAFKHGAGEKVGQAWINIELAMEGEVLKFKINNSKPEQPVTQLVEKEGNIGLENVQRRLELIYPNAHQLKIFDEEEMFAVILKIDLSQNLSI